MIILTFVVLNTRAKAPALTFPKQDYEHRLTLNRPGILLFFYILWHQLSIGIGVMMSNDLIILSFLIISVLLTVGGLVWFTVKN